MNDTDPPGTVVAFPGAGPPKQNATRELADFAAGVVTGFEEKTGQEPIAVAVVVMTKGATVYNCGRFVVGPEEGLSGLYTSMAAHVLAAHALD